ncbi:hypothetical protein NQ314_003318 [Rhamnusium bicolor]|uniref:Thyroglobulin type-1 domain-containing protein n=1 Tax=Rhamnusium bicolor TaxID=1586634 RepID=A0AAV8ZPA0_9CUCU|nr:hypothetical protein NQ314_003318 [Rhamnusium bicolor]
MKGIFVLSLLFSSFLVYGQTCDKLLITDFSQQDCVNRHREDITYYYWINEDECLPFCQAYTFQGPARTMCPCPPAYACEKRCSGTGSCMAYHANTSDFTYNKFTALKFKPACNVDGLWNAKQCKGGVSGRCFCFDARGNRLFGQATYLESQDMTCACSRRKADLEASGRPYVSFHCDSMGNYEKLQCDSGLCWCAEPKTGELTAPIVPEKAMIKLPCCKNIFVK